MEIVYCRLMAPPIPSLSSVDWFFPPGKTGRDEHTSQPLVKVHLSKSGKYQRNFSFFKTFCFGMLVNSYHPVKKEIQMSFWKKFAFIEIDHAWYSSNIADYFFYFRSDIPIQEIIATRVNIKEEVWKFTTPGQNQKLWSVFPCTYWF